MRWCQVLYYTLYTTQRLCYIGVVGETTHYQMLRRSDSTSAAGFAVHVEFADYALAPRATSSSGTEQRPAKSSAVTTSGPPKPSTDIDLKNMALRHGTRIAIYLSSWTTARIAPWSAEHCFSHRKRLNVVTFAFGAEPVFAVACAGLRLFLLGQLRGFQLEVGLRAMSHVMWGFRLEPLLGIVTWRCKRTSQQHKLQQPKSLGPKNIWLPNTISSMFQARMVAWLPKRPCLKQTSTRASMATKHNFVRVPRACR